MKKLFIVFTILLNCSIYATKIKWLDFNTALKKAGKEKKMMVVDFYTNWCGYCKKMDRETYKNKKVVQKLNKYFISAKVDGENSTYKVLYDNKKYTIREFLSALEINGFPAIGFLDKNGKFLTVVSGFYDARNLLSVLDYIKDSCYVKEIKFSDYKNNPKICLNKK